MFICANVVYHAKLDSALIQQEDMMRLSIEVTPEQHQRLKAVAALRGQSIKDYVLERVLPDIAAADEDEALRQLEAFLEPRIKAAKDAAVHKSVEQIFEEIHREAR
jgi:hypothetical protein